MASFVLKRVCSLFSKLFQFFRIAVIHFYHAGLVEFSVHSAISKILLLGAADATLEETDKVL